MNLYLISQTTNNNYDTYSDAVVCAKSAKEAQYIRPDGYTLDEISTDWSWTSPDNVTVEYLGKAGRGVSPGVILASFHAG